MIDRVRAGGLVIAMLGFTVAACGRSPRGMVPPVASPDTAARGVVRVVGAAPGSAVVLTSAGRQVELGGPLAAELARLDGAVVAVRGAAGAPRIPLGADGRAIEVRSYVIDSIAGGVPVVGVLRRDGRRVAVGGVPIAHPPAGLAELVGARVWVVGVRTPNGELEVQTFGVLAPAAAAAPAARDTAAPDRR